MSTPLRSRKGDTDETSLRSLRHAIHVPLRAVHGLPVVLYVQAPDGRLVGALRIEARCASDAENEIDVEEVTYRGEGVELDVHHDDLCDLPESIKEAFNMGDGSYHP